VDPLALQVAQRWAADKVPVRNRDTGRIVHVTPETLKKKPGEYERVTDDTRPTSHEPKKPAQARKPAPPHKPHKPHTPRKPPPAPIHPPEPVKPLKPPKPVKPPKPAKPPEPPKHTEPPKWRREKKAEDMVLRVIGRFLDQ